MKYRPRHVTDLLGAPVVRRLISRLQRHADIARVRVHRIGRTTGLKTDHPGGRIFACQLTQLLVGSGRPGFAVVRWGFAHYFGPFVDQLVNEPGLTPYGAGVTSHLSYRPVSRARLDGCENSENLKPLGLAGPDGFAFPKAKFDSSVKRSSLQPRARKKCERKEIVFGGTSEIRRFCPCGYRGRQAHSLQIDVDYTLGRKMLRLTTARIARAS